MALNENLKMKVNITDLCAGSLEEPDTGKLVTIGVLKELIQDGDEELDSIDDIANAITSIKSDIVILNRDKVNLDDYTSFQQEYHQLENDVQTLQDNAANTDKTLESLTSADATINTSISELQNDLSDMKSTYALKTDLNNYATADSLNTLTNRVDALPTQDTTYDLTLNGNILQLRGSDNSVDEVTLPEGGEGGGSIATDENGAIAIGPTSIKNDSPLYDFIDSAAPAAAISDGSVAFGLGTQAGVWGYYWYELRDNGDSTYTFILSNKQNELDPVTDCDWQLEDYLCFVNEHKYYCVYQILTVNGNEVTFQGPLPTDWEENLRATKTDLEPEEFSIFALKIDRDETNGYDKPIFRSGSMIFGWSAFVAGLDNFAVGSLSTVFGYRNIANDYGFTAGRNNVAGYGSIVGGWNNLGIAQKSLIIGRNNTSASNADNSILGGNGNTLLASNSIVQGSGNTLKNEAYQSIIVGEGNSLSNFMSAVFGSGNISITDSDSGTGRVLIAGHENKNTGDFNIIAGRKNTVSGSYNAVFGGYHKNDNAETGHSISGKYATIGGAQHSVKGNGNAVFGAFNTVNQGYCLVAGRGCSATSEGQVVLGQYNVADDNAALIIGAGSSTSPKNIFTVSKEGRITAGAAPDVDNPNGLDVVTVDYLKNYLLDKEW